MIFLHYFSIGLWLWFFIAATLQSRKVSLSKRALGLCAYLFFLMAAVTTVFSLPSYWGKHEFWSLGGWFTLLAFAFFVLLAEGEEKVRKAKGRIALKLPLIGFLAVISLEKSNNLVYLFPFLQMFCGLGVLYLFLLRKKKFRFSFRQIIFMNFFLILSLIPHELVRQLAMTGASIYLYNAFNILFIAEGFRNTVK